MQKLRTAVVGRGIPFLLHFTKVTNVETILRYGLRSRKDLAACGLSPSVSATARLDGRDDAISISVSTYNYEMFEAKRFNSNSRWVVIAFAPDVLWTHTCIFHRRNAAKRKMIEHRGSRCGPWGFNEMFSDEFDNLGGSYRRNNSLSDYITTFPDAEVQVLNPIAPNLILGAWVNCADLVEPLQMALSELLGPGIPVALRSFFPRLSIGNHHWG